MIVARTVAEARAAVRGLPRPLGLVPTMGALHDGHLSLVAAARGRCASVAASLFVNPKQFGEGEDFARYPRTEARDLELFERAGADVVFAPAAEEMYAAGAATTIHVGGPATEAFEGACRPDHFDGVATVVAKLFTIVAPDVAFFGQKDAQQVAVVRRMARDLDLPVEIAPVPTLREPDGLAMSSRNVYLTPAQRRVAPDLYVALLAGARAASRPGAGPRDAVAAACMALVAPAGPPAGGEPRGPDAERPRFEVEYIAAVDGDTFAPATHLRPGTLLVAAARLGTTRLIDNVPLGPPAAAEPHTPTNASSDASAYPARDATD